MPENNSVRESENSFLNENLTIVANKTSNSLTNFNSSIELLSVALSNSNVSTEINPINISVSNNVKSDVVAPKNNSLTKVNFSNSVQHSEKNISQNNFPNVSLSFQNSLLQATSIVDIQNWKQNDLMKNFSQSQDLEKSRLQNHFETISNKKNQQFKDKLNWQEISKIKNFTRSANLEKSRLQKHFHQSVESSRSKDFFFQTIFERVFSKMPIDCGDKTCSLEFHETKDVSNLFCNLRSFYLHFLHF